MRAVIQAGYLLLLSRWLGATGYGLFAGSVAMAIFVAPLANWGSALVLTRHVASERNRSRGMWATALLQTGVTGGLLTIVIIGVSVAFFHERVGLGAMFLLALSELILLPAAQVATSQCFAVERLADAVVRLLREPVPVGDRARLRDRLLQTHNWEAVSDAYAGALLQSLEGGKGHG